MHSAHYPAPWHVANFAKPWWVVNDNGGRIVVEVLDDLDAARLIAAAPALLASLTECLATLERLDARLLSLTGSPYEHPLGEVTRARAAIARATGEA